MLAVQTYKDKRSIRPSQWLIMTFSNASNSFWAFILIRFQIREFCSHQNSRKIDLQDFEGRKVKNHYLRLRGKSGQNVHLWHIQPLDLCKNFMSFFFSRKVNNFMLISFQFLAFPSFFFLKVLITVFASLFGFFFSSALCSFFSNNLGRQVKELQWVKFPLGRVAK